GDAIDRALADARIDVADLGRRAVDAGNPVVALVAQLLDVVPESARPWLHHGSTSQDVFDTALMVVAAQASTAVAAHAQRAGHAASYLAGVHRNTLMLARTLGQQALPTTFGAKSAGWAAGLISTAGTLAEVRRTRLAVQLGGAGGTLAAFGDVGLAVLTALAGELGLADPGRPWHTERSRIQELGAALASVTAAAGKVGTDIVLLAQNEVGEVRESGGPGHGGSSALPQKRNPVTSVLVRSAALRSPGLLGTLFTAGLPEHERSFGSWHAEWQPLRQLFGLAGGATARIADVLAGLDVDAARMRSNLDAAGPAVMAESLTTRLSPAMGRRRAHQVVAAALTAAADADGRITPTALRSAILAHDEVSLEAADVDAALDPENYLGACGQLVDRILADDRATEGHDE
ncbi:MAG TPA: lyase family protein, partial [Jiangellaceae bacterium]|nr:lyase family protein [Jiangellaceae bacterium]